MFELAGIAYVGSGVLGSSAGMDKGLMKRLFKEAAFHREARDRVAQRVGEVAEEGGRKDRGGA